MEPRSVMDVTLLTDAGAKSSTHAILETELQPARKRTRSFRRLLPKDSTTIDESFSLTRPPNRKGPLPGPDSRIRATNISKARRVSACQDCRSRKKKCTHWQDWLDPGPDPGFTFTPIPPLPLPNSPSQLGYLCPFSTQSEYETTSANYIDNELRPSLTPAKSSLNYALDRYGMNSTQYWTENVTEHPLHLTKLPSEKLWAIDDPLLSCGYDRLIPGDSLILDFNTGPKSQIPPTDSVAPKVDIFGSDRDATIDSSVDPETSSMGSDMDTDYEGMEGWRDHLHCEICRSNQGKRLTNVKVRQLRRERLLKDPKKQRLIDLLMSEFYVIFRKASTEFRSCAGGNSSASQGSLLDTTPKSCGSSTQATRAKHSIGGSERNPEEYDDDDDGDDRRPPKRLRSFPMLYKDKLSGLKFACPYHQHNPQKYGIDNGLFDANYRSCAGPGFLSIARMKEHLYRRHRIPIRCNRCGFTFKSQEFLKAHVRVLVPCEVQAEVPIEGVTEDIEKRLKSRKKISPDQSDEDRWKAVYHILFPNEETPCPYYEHDSNLAAFQEYSNRETPMVFLRILGSRASTNQLTQEIQNELVDIVRECRIFVYRRYHQDKARKSPATVEKIDATLPSLASNDSQSDNSYAETHLQPQGDIEDPADYDPADFESIFRDNFGTTMDSAFDNLDWEPKVQYQCLCYGPCSCPLLPGSKNPM